MTYFSPSPKRRARVGRLAPVVYCLLLLAGRAARAQAPTIATLSPGSGAMGSTFALTGTNPNATTSVRLGGQPAAFVINSATSLTVTVPPGASTHKVSVTTPGGTALSNATFGVDKVNNYAFPLVPGSFSGIDVGFNAAPAFADLDGNQLLDMVATQNKVVAR